MTSYFSWTVKVFPVFHQFPPTQNLLKVLRISSQTPPVRVWLLRYRLQFICTWDFAAASLEIYWDNKPHEFTNFRPVSSKKVSGLISFKVKSCDLDPVPAPVLKPCLSVLTPVITEIVNRSLATGLIPQCLKATQILPLPCYRWASSWGELGQYRKAEVIENFLEKCHIWIPSAWMRLTLGSGGVAFQDFIFSAMDLVMVGHALYI